MRDDLDEVALLGRARAGSEQAYGELVEVHRAELRAHCYRMLGSVHDAEDALQDALLRAWRGLARFEGRSSLRSWLYKIATNAALDVAERRGRRELPTARGPAASFGQDPGAPLLEAVWIEPYPDQAFPVGDGFASPEARYEQRESLELAFVAALQQLAPLQRAVLIMRDVLGFSGQEVAALLDTTVPAVQSALQRARSGARDRIPARSQQATMRALGDERLRGLVTRFADAIECGDVGRVVEMLTEDATWAMPPIVTWYGGREAIAEFLKDYGLNERWRYRATRVNGQLALGGYTYEESTHRWVPSILEVLTLNGERVAEVTGFVTAELLARWGYQDDRLIGATAFPRFGLPAQLPS